MCGIAGFNLAPDERVDTRALTRELLLSIEDRGRHATGVAYHDPKGASWIQKDAMPATAFVRDLDMPNGAVNAVLHTRYATQGSVADNRNNHPIEIPGLIMGVHNGVLWNDDEMFAEIGPEKRIAKVDSEAIFAALAYLPGKPTHALGKVEGSAAVGWIEPLGDPNALHVARVSSSPLAYAYTEAGSFIFASTESALRRATERAHVPLATGPHSVPERTYLKVRHGEVVAKHVFEVERDRTSVPLTAVERAALNV